MKELVKTACTRRIAGNALQVSLVVGTVLNVINQGGALFSVEGISWPQVLMNYLVPYCVASYSAARNEMAGISRE